MNAGSSAASQGADLAMSASPPRIALFTYDFPHKKTQELLLRLIVEGLKPVLVIAAPHVNLSSPRAPVRLKPLHIDLVEPAAICKAFELPYLVAPHNSAQVPISIGQSGATLGVIGGARILSPSILRAFPLGIINMHPALLPEVRGLDSLQWTIHNRLQFGVTAHLIDSRIDCGRLIERHIIREYPEDTLIEISLRLEQAQVRFMPAAIRSVISGVDTYSVLPEGAQLNHSYPAEGYDELLELFRARPKDRCER